MIIKDIKDVEKWVREATLEELKDNIKISIGRMKTKRDLVLYLLAMGDNLERRGFASDKKNVGGEK